MKIADVIELDGSKMFFTGRTISRTPRRSRRQAMERTVVFYHNCANAYPEAGWIGAVAAAPVGSVTWKFKEIKGLSPLEISATELQEIHDAGAVAYFERPGVAGQVRARHPRGYTLISSTPRIT
ncbi:hypothetical protein WJ0W_004595 [Paenibacillus melissococcoides]|uniref:Uncharacterized protein n=1 Tax=Paenibacillus melissococcoides TaxID=2912268 RepID=A0ABM9G6X3_9BACL|nr:hypothetical protein [Paenibacillus melissococcoides]CAH8247361.1 hypothetical protein WJ0W_004595 [Paenibacillus melissococcoides]